MTEPTWSREDQIRVDAFAAQVLKFADAMPGSRDAVVVAFTQATGSLMRQRLVEDPTRAPFYLNMIAMLQTHVSQAIPPETGDTTH